MNNKVTNIGVNKYLNQEIPKGLTPAEKVVHVWTVPLRTPEHLRAWTLRLQKEWPEMYDALQELTSETTRGESA